ncbi:MAG: CPBP family intramembrane glutamic endopeptidase [archaeon]
MAQRVQQGKVRAAAVATGVSATGIVLSIVTAIPVLLFVEIEADGSTSLVGFTALFVASYVGLLLTALGFLRYAGKGLEYFDLEWPSRRDLKYVAAGVVAIFAVVLVLGVLYAVVGLETTPNAITEPGYENPNYLLVLVPLVIFVNAPAEELLFRNVVQKSLYGPFSRRGAVLTASAIFALVHVPAYYHPDPVVIASSVGVIFGGSVVFGWVYARTDNLVVPSLVHGLFNAIQVLLLYSFVTTDPTLGVA